MGRDAVIIPHAIVLIIFILSPRVATPFGEYIPSMIAAAYLCFHILMKTITINIKLFIYICFICSFIYLRTIFTEDVYDTALLKLSIGILLAYFLGVAFSTRFKLSEALKIIAIAGVLNSVLITVEFIIPELKAMIENMLIQNNSGLIYADHPFQMRGIASAGGAALSIFNFTCVYLLLYEVNFKKKFVTVLSVFVLLVSCVVIGRTGLAAILMLLIFWIITNLIKKNYKYSKFTLISMVLFIIYYSFYFLETDVLEQDYLIWSMEILTLFNGSENKTLAHLAPMIVFPEGWHLLYGSGSFERQVGYVQSDIGYLKTLHFGGLLFCLLFYGFFLVLTIYLRNMNKKYIAILLLIFFIFELKEPFFVQNINSRLWFFVAGFIYPVFRKSNRAAD